MPKLHKSQEAGDKPLLSDAMFNFVPGSSFEIGTSLAILDNPGEAGKHIDGYAKQVDEVLDKVYKTPLGDQLITISPGAAPITLKRYFDNKILNELRPGSDQIGRCLDTSKAGGWFTGEGRDWLKGELGKASNGPDYNYTNMLTKIRTISAVGTIMRELMPQNKHIAATLVGKSEVLIESRNAQVATQIRHAEFDSVKTRARTEKMPIIEGTSLGSFEGVSTKTVDAGPVGLGFGRVWHPTGIDVPADVAAQGTEPQIKAQEAREAVVAKYRAVEAAKGRQGMERVGQDMKDPGVPGLLGDSSRELMPKEFKEAGLPKQLEDHRFEHGSGLNRWQLTGEYPKSSWNASMPAAGAHSGGTSDIFLALNCLDEDSVFGRKDAKEAGLLVSSFMNFGGYHSFVETFPIA